MIAKSSILDHLVEDSFKRRETNPLLKRAIFAATQTALQQVAPDDYHKKCHGASAAIYMILRTLRVRSSICGGTVSWLYGGTDESGVSWQSRCGFWSENPGLLFPHTWVVTEFDGIVDLACSYFDKVHVESQKAGLARDVVPAIWMRTVNLNALPSVQYNATARFREVTMQDSDEPARRLIGDALTAFWGQSWVDAVIQDGTDHDRFMAELYLPSFDDNLILDGTKSVETYRDLNTWVARNSLSPTANMLTKPPVS